MRLPFDKTFPISCDFQCHLDSGGWIAKLAGVDFACPEDTPLYAIESGNAYAFIDTDGALIINLWVNSNRCWQYVHLKSFNIPINKTFHVNEGDLLGKSGKSGRANGFHLHLALIINKIRVDPMNDLNQTQKPRFLHGDFVKIVGETKIRKDPSAKIDTNILGYVQSNSRGLVISDGMTQIRYNDGFTWYYVEFLDHVGWMVENNLEKSTETTRTNIDSSVPQINLEDPKVIEEQKVEIENLKKQIQELKQQVDDNKMSFEHTLDTKNLEIQEFKNHLDEITQTKSDSVNDAIASIKQMYEDKNETLSILELKNSQLQSRIDGMGLFATIGHVTDVIISRSRKFLYTAAFKEVFELVERIKLSIKNPWKN